MKWITSNESFIFKQLNTITEPGLSRIERPGIDIDVLDWLNHVDIHPKLYWRHRDTHDEIAAVGCVRHHSEVALKDWDCTPLIRSLDRAPTARYWGGFRFDTQRDIAPEWQRWGTGQLILPAFEWIKQQDRITFAVNVWLDPKLDRDTQLDQVRLNFQTLKQPMLPLETPRFEFRKRVDSPNYSQWGTHIQTILDAISNDALSKVVLSRKSSFLFSDPIDPFQMIQHIRAVDTKSYLFVHQLSPHSAFLSGTPERLFYRDTDQLVSEALASTLPRGNNVTEDQRLADELLNSPKYIREHAIVADQLASRLRRICDTIHHHSAPIIRKLPIIQHTLTTLKATLKQGISDADILTALHPTPAVSGEPNDAALAMIRQLEVHDRGIYAGPVGYIGHDQSEWIVALRSGIIEKNTISLYSGAGIVKGSDPLLEWSEIEHKIGLFKRLFLGQNTPI